MKYAIWIVFLSLCCAPAPWSYAQQPALEDVLKRVGETYQKLQTYQFFAQKTTELAAVGTAESPTGGRAWSNFHKSETSEIGLAATSPGKFRLDVTDEKGGLVLVSDGQTRWTYVPKRKQYTEEPGTTTEPDVLRSYRVLLVDRFRGISQYASNAVLEKDSQLKIGGDKVACYVLRIPTQHGSYELWVDKDRYIVLRSKHVGPAASEGISLQETTTINLSQANINNDLQANVFQFTPPDKAEKVASLESKK